MDDPFEDRFDDLWRVGYRVAWRLCANTTDAEDVTAETLGHALHSWSDIRDPAAWVSRVAGRRAMRHIKRRRSIPAPQVTDHEHSPATFDGDLAAAIVRLPRRQREVIVLRYIADLSEETTAQTLGISVGSVKTHASRALVRLRERLADRPADPPIPFDRQETTRVQSHRST